ncbi:hypothetical protein AB0I60_12580 [Actinosynnema sp. NPDC050436]|uniref:hypothetical protein n=1 Tax=Actinosynnema sp. NPDC050436 TaxID=3155659 RepID=UPI0033C77C40
MPGRVVEGVVRGFVTVHAVAVFAQPVFAGGYLTGEYDLLAWHALGADVVSYLAVAQLVPTALLWRRGGARWPFWVTVLLLVGETGQYFAGLAGALDLHVPLGVALAVLASTATVAVWRTGGRR